MREIPLLVQDVTELDAQDEGTDALVDIGVPLPFRLAVTFRIAVVEIVGEIRVEFKLVLGDVGSRQAQLGVHRIQVDAGIQGVACDIVKRELDAKLQDFSVPQDNLEETFENREQIEVSKYYEKLPKPTLLATQEFVENKVYWRDPSRENQIQED